MLTALTGTFQSAPNFLNALENAQRSQIFASNERFPGQYYDAETGHNYNYYRDYDPGTGRYIEPDPIGVTGVSKRAEDFSRAYWLFTTGEKIANPQLITFPSSDIYLYTDQNPFNATDAKGQNLVLVVAAVAIVAAAYATSFYYEWQCQKKVCENPKMCPYTRNAGETDEGKADAWIYQCKAQCARGIVESLKLLGEAN